MLSYMVKRIVRDWGQPEPLYVNPLEQQPMDDDNPNKLTVLTLNVWGLPHTPAHEER